MRLFLLLLFFVGCLAEEEEEFTQFAFLEGRTGAWNFTTILLGENDPLRAILHSIEGDADLYLSTSLPNANFFEVQDRSSTTCGLDYIDIPAISTEAYLSIYGHPSHPESKWRLLLVAGRNSSVSEGEFDVEPEVIYQWDRLKKAWENPPSKGSSLQLFLEILADYLFDLVQILAILLH